MNKLPMLTPEEAHVDFIATHLRASDLEELQALGVTSSTAQALAQCVKLSALCWVMLYNGEPVAVTGVIPVEYGVPPQTPQGLRPLTRSGRGKIPPTRAERQAGGCLGTHPYQGLSLSPLPPHSECEGGTGGFGKADAVEDGDGGTIVSRGGGATYTNSAGAPWLVGTDKIARCPVRFMRSSHWAIAEYLKNFSYLHNIVDARQAKSLRYLKALGFTLDPPRPFGNGTFHKFYLETK